MAEAIGLVCGILPLILSAAGHYLEAATAFSRHRMHVSEAANIASTLKIQRVIFRAANRTLLGRCIGEELAAQMLDNGRHPLWADTVLELQLRQRLGDSLDATVESMRLIEDELRKLDNHRHKLGRVELEAKKHGDTNVKTSYKTIRRKLKFAYAELPFQEILDRLRDLTQDFRVLIEQRAAIVDRRKADSKLSEAIDKSIVHFRMVQAAAKDLYAALSLACTKHSEYEVYLGIQPSQNNSSPEFRFGIDFKNSVVGYAGFMNGPLWLRFGVITASTQSSDSREATTLPGIVETLKSKSPLECDPDTEGTKRAKKSVRFRCPTPPPATTANQHDESSLKAHNIVSDICGLLQSSRVLSRSEITHCVGSPGYTVGSKYLLSCEDALQRNVKNRPPTFISLASLFARPPRMNKGVGLSFFDRVRLARLLATAVLRFHATPWLKYTLCSTDIFLHSADSSVINTISIQDEIYLKTSIRGPDCSSLEESPPFSRSLVRNPVIFALGVVLLELAFEAPLHSLQKPTDVAPHEDQNTDYYIADRVRLTVSSMLGPRYADLVRKCIHCDFRRGDDLNGIGLQESFYVEVVQELEDLEAKFDAFGLGG